MKAKLYTILTGLLMTTCITSYGQEIVTEFTSNSYSYDCDIVEASDGSIIVGSYYGGDNYTIYKLSPEGTPIDSITLPGTASLNINQLLEVPATPDCFLVVCAKLQSFSVMLKFILMDADFFILNEANTSIQTGASYGMDYKAVFLTPDKRIVVPYTIHNGENNVKRYAFYSLSGTLLTNLTINEILNDASLNAPEIDTLLGDFHFKSFTASPITYSCLGRYDMDGEKHFVNYILDNSFNFTNRIEYAPIAPEMPFSNTGATVLPFDQPDVETHLLFAYTSPSQPTFIRYDNDGTSIAFHRFPEASSDPSYRITAADQNTIYYSHGKFQFGSTQHLIRLNGNLETVWEIPLPCPNTQQNLIRSMKVLQNGNVAIGTSLYKSSNTSILQVFIIHDGYDTTPESTKTECPFTLYPNPVKDHLTLRFDDGKEPEGVELYSLAGSLVAKQCKDLEIIDMSAMPTGVYMLRVIMKDGASYHEKIFKE